MSKIGAETDARGHIGRRRLRVASVVVMLALGSSLASGCHGERRDVSGIAPYNQMIGQKFRVVGAVEALAIRLFGDDGPSYLSLHSAEPPYTGDEIMFRQPVARGQEFRIVAAGLQDTVWDDTYYYVVEFNPPLEPKLAVHLRLRGELVAGAARLNPRYFEPVR